MPHPNVETLRRIDQAQVVGDLETVVSQYTDDVPWGMWAATAS